MVSRKVLVIDDEASIRQSLTGALNDEGYQVLVAASGRDGIEAVRFGRPDVVLLDIWMPDLDGIETLRLIKSEVGRPDRDHDVWSWQYLNAVKATKLGAFDFIEKPLSLERLLVLLQECLAFRISPGKIRLCGNIFRKTGFWSARVWP